ncbi:MAG: purine-nucleoside phosphorylase [Planctomycetota bacterium]|nr:purine-nucleoside phosphorylase [Planctomycetota bacterium]MEC9046554.1 purine-nucleoside phosphorylase [Planctomycetota bacterium]
MSAHQERARVERAASWLEEQVGRERCADVALAMVLGSGLKSFAEALEDRVEVPFADVPEWPRPNVEGHGGAVVFGAVAGARVACLTGRVHLYEGWSPSDAVRCVRTLRTLGAPRFLLTNAAGGIGDGLVAGDLMVLTDHLNLTGQSPLTGAHDEAFGPRFPDMSEVYARSLREHLLAAGDGLKQGVYAGLLGPSYETPAEVRMLRGLGADAVGMSTVHEAIALKAMGAELCGLSLISNLAAGISEQPLSHAEVIEEGRAAAARMTGVVSALCGRLA